MNFISIKWIYELFYKCIFLVPKNTECYRDVNLILSFTNGAPYSLALLSQCRLRRPFHIDSAIRKKSLVNQLWDLWGAVTTTARVRFANIPSSFSRLFLLWWLARQVAFWLSEGVKSVRNKTRSCAVFELCAHLKRACVVLSNAVGHFRDKDVRDRNPRS